MRMAIGKEKEQALDLDALAVGQEFLKAAGAEIGQPFHQHIDLMKTFAVRQLVQQLKEGTFRRGQGEGPIPRPPRLISDAALEWIVARARIFLDVELQTAQAVRDWFVLEETQSVVVNELHAEIELAQPAWQRFLAVQMDRLGLLREVMGKALKLERGPPADHDRVLQDDGLERYDGLLPGELATWLAIDAASGLLEPASGYIVTDELAGVAVLLQPSGGNEKALGKVSFQAV